jgi:hypothetical protein
MKELINLSNCNCVKSTSRFDKIELVATLILGNFAVQPDCSLVCQNHCLELQHSEK